MKYRFVISLLLVLAMVGSASADLSQVELELVGSDIAEEVDYDDMTDLWIGETEEELVLVVRFNGTEHQGASVNFTIRDTSNLVYLVTVAIHNESYTVLIQNSDGIFDPSVSADNTLNVQYLEKSVFYDPVYQELGVYLYWDDLGGNQEVDVIAWTGMPGPDSDRIPTTGYATFSSVQTVHRTMDFSAALAGNFERTEFSTTQPSTPIKSNEASATTYTSAVDRPSVEPETRSIVPILLLAGFLIISLIILGRRGSSAPQSAPVKTLQSPKKEVPQQPSAAKFGEVGTKYIPELDREVRMCCFQTARLEETYCYCGRAVQDDVRELFRQ